MAAEITTHYKRPDTETIYVEDEDITKRGGTACCICNSNNSMCLAEQGFTHYATATAAQTLAYFIT